MRQNGARRARRLGVPILALVSLWSCSSGDEESDLPPPFAAFTLDCSGVAAAAPDQVRMGCPASSSQTLAVQVLIDGPTSSSDVYGVKFDLVFDSESLRYLPPAVEGVFLNKDGGGTILEADISGSDPDRLVVALTRQGAVPGVQATGSGELVMTLLFSGVLRRTSTITFDNAAAVDSNLVTIPAIQFQGPLTVTVR